MHLPTHTSSAVGVIVVERGGSRPSGLGGSTSAKSQTASDNVSERLCLLGRYPFACSAGHLDTLRVDTLPPPYPVETRPHQSRPLRQVWIRYFLASRQHDLHGKDMIPAGMVLQDPISVQPVCPERGRVGLVLIGGVMGAASI